MTLLSLFQYGFAVRALEAGVIVALVAPLIGIFLVLRRYSLIADTFAHVSLAGITIGFLLGWNPMLTALGATLASSLGIERLRSAKKVYGESALAIFLSGSLALAVVLASVGKGLNADILHYLFGSIVTVTPTDVAVIAALAAVVAGVIALFYKELVFISFDEESAAISGIKTRLINIILIMLAAFTVAIAIPIVGVLLISALMIVPVATALQMKKSFVRTLFYAEIISVCSVVTGIIASFALNLSTGGTIVLIMIAFFMLTLGYKGSSGQVPRY